MKCNAQQPALASRHDKWLDVEEGRGKKLSVLQHSNASDLFNDEEAIRPVRSVSRIDRALEAGGDQRELERVLGGTRRGRRKR